jgi:hypothetical protein
MGGTTGTDTRVVQGVPLAPRPQDKEDGIHGSAVIDAWPVASQWVRLPGRQEGHKALPQSVGHAPITTDFFRGTHVHSSYDREDLPLGYH